MRILVHEKVNRTTPTNAVPTLRRTIAIAVVGALFGAIYGIALGGALSLMFGNPWKILFFGGTCALIGSAACIVFALVTRMNDDKSEPASAEGTDDATHDDPTWTDTLLVPQALRHRELRHRFASAAGRERHRRDGEIECRFLMLGYDFNPECKLKFAVKTGAPAPETR